MRQLIEPLDALDAYRVCDQLLAMTGGKLPTGERLPMDYPHKVQHPTLVARQDLTIGLNESAEAERSIRQTVAAHPLAFGADEAGG